MSNRYKKFDFKSIHPKDNLSKKNCENIIDNVLLNKNGKINPNTTKHSFITKRNLVTFFESLFYYTSFIIINNDDNIIERLYCFHNNIYHYPKCHYCETDLINFHGNFSNGGYGKFCSHYCHGKVNHPKANQTNEQWIITNIKKGLKRKGVPLTTEHKKKLKIAANKKSVKNKKKQTCMKRYGVENPGVLGAYSSKSAKLYIKNFITENKFDDKQCFYSGGGVNNKEFFQMINIPWQNKKRYVSYDLIVFNDIKSAQNKDMNNIFLVFEYNGPWHYKNELIIGKEHEPATPYKNNTSKKQLTKGETVMFDKCKIDHIMKFTNNVIIFWEKSKTREMIMKLGDC